MPDQAPDPITQAPTNCEAVVFPPSQVDASAPAPVLSNWDASHEQQVRQMSEVESILSLREHWGNASTSLALAIMYHPETDQKRRRPDSEAENTPSGTITDNNDLDETVCRRHILAARTHLHPYQRFFTTWLTRESFDTQLLSNNRPGSTAIPTQIEVVELVSKVSQLCEWETKNPLASPLVKPRVPALEEIKQTLVALEQLLALVNPPAKAQPSDRPVPLPRLDDGSGATDR